MEDLLEVGY